MKMAEVMGVCKSKVFDKHRESVQKWAAANAYMLVTITVFFVITWIFIIVSIWAGYRHG